MKTRRDTTTIPLQWLSLSTPGHPEEFTSAYFGFDRTGGAALMKARPNADFPVHVRHHSPEVVPETAHLYENVFDVRLNYEVSLRFVPDVSHLAPPWEATMLPPDVDVITEVSQARLASAMLSSYTVTPNARHAGTEERLPAFGRAEWAGVVFYVAPAEFDRYQADLTALSEATSGRFAGLEVGGLRGYEVVTFIERRILDSAWLRPRDATMLGRPTPPARA
jgi:hypothetical protein